MKKVVEAGKDADELYREAKALGEDILRRRDELDAAINGTLENYSPERVSAIDRAILRLGAYELLHRKDLAAPIVISGSHPPGGTLLLRGIPPLRQRRAGRHLKNGTPGVTTTLYHGWIL